MERVMTIGLDIAKSVFQVHGVELVSIGCIQTSIDRLHRARTPFYRGTDLRQRNPHTLHRK